MRLLKLTLVLNAASCAVFGLIFLFASKTVNVFIGNATEWLVPAIGGILLLNGLHLLLASRRSKPICPEILYFILGDALWVAGSIILMAFGIVVTSVHGIVGAALIAVMVGAFGVMQAVGYKNACTSRRA